MHCTVITAGRREVLVIRSDVTGQYLGSTQ